VPKIIPVIKAVPKIPDIQTKKVEAPKVVVSNNIENSQTNKFEDNGSSQSSQVQEEKKPEKLDFFSQLKAVQLRKSAK
jgi:hypothetical protein